VEEDVRTLYDSGEGGEDMDYIAFCGIILNRSNNALRAISHEYHRRHRRALTHVIENEFSGHPEHTLMYALLGALDPLHRDARLIHAAIQHHGAKEERLTYRIIRAYWLGGQPHLQGVKNAFQENYEHNLIKMVATHTHGHHEKLMVTILEGN
jgi:annexin A7/11